MIKRIYLHLAVTMLLVAWLPGVASAVEDGCDDADGSTRDIKTLVASFDETTGYIEVELTLCGNADDETKYRVHFDHTAPFATDPDRNGDGFITPDDFCVTTSDNTMMHRSKKDTGPGQIMVYDNVLTYRVTLAELRPGLEIGDTIFVWADTQYKGLQDRAPDTDASDGCAKPEAESELIELVLAPSELVISDLRVESGKYYEIVYNGLFQNVTYYFDLPIYKVNTLPPDLLGSTFIRTAFADRNYASDAFMRFTINKSATVYVGYDTRDDYASWLDSFMYTGKQIITSDPTCNFRLFKKDFSAGEVILGGNKVGVIHSKVMYIVIITESS
jgi:hypothetical protein